MGIGIVTFHNANNYGAVLQCYALSEVLIRNGNTVELINLPLHNKAKNIRSILRSKLSSAAFFSFRNNFLPKSVDSDEQKDIYIFGSDQIWNIDITQKNYKLYFGSWIKDKSSRIAYAASFGTSKWNFPEYTSNIQSLLSLFNSISIRESSGIDICKEEFDIECKKVLDPTLLLNNYNHLFKPKNINKAMVCYIFGKDDLKIKEIGNISQKTNLQPILLNDMRFRRGIKSIPFPPVSKWLSYLNSSELVLTDSFHCMVFAIIFKKNFIAIPAIPERVDRMLSLLNDLGLESRFFNNIDEVSKSQVLVEDIDYHLVDEKLEKLRVDSLQFLEDSLKSVTE